MKKQPMNYFLALGSNLGRRESYLTRARNSLERAGIVILRSSSIYETEPVDHLDQPWFLNQVVEVRTGLHPIPLLNTVKIIEAELGRKNSFTKGPRSIDIDILLQKNRIFRSRNLVIPHPGLHKRKFILIALREISPDIRHPVFKVSVDRLLQMVRDSSEVKIYRGY